MVNTPPPPATATAAATAARPAAAAAASAATGSSAPKGVARRFTTTDAGRRKEVKPASERKPKPPRNPATAFIRKGTVPLTGPKRKTPKPAAGKSGSQGVAGAGPATEQSKGTQQVAGSSSAKSTRVTKPKANPSKRTPKKPEAVLSKIEKELQELGGNTPDLEKSRQTRSGARKAQR